MSAQPYPDEQTWWPDVFDVEVAKRYAVVGRSYPDPHDPQSLRWCGRTAYDIATGLTKEAALSKHLRELEDALGLTPQPQPGQPTNRPLFGPLRIEQKLFRDDSGYRRVFFCSWFPALRILRDNPAEFERQLNVIAANNYQGIRVFLAVGGWTPYWDGREVAPIRFEKCEYQDNALRPHPTGRFIEAWPDYDDLFRQLLRACRARKLRLHVTCGDMQIICPNADQEVALHQRLARIAAEEGGTDVIALWEVTNEYPINRYGGNSDQSIAQMGRVIASVKGIMPTVLCAQGANPANEEPEQLMRASTYGDVCVSHTTRDPFPTCLKRTFGLIYYEGNYRGFPKPFKQGEPAGPGTDSYAAQNDPANLTALYAMHALTGQDSNYFNGPAVRSHEPLESTWGFTQLPALFARHLPETVALWSHGSNGRGGIEYWWNGKSFATVTYTDWDPSPPQPVATWTLYAGDTVTTGTGAPARATGLLVGEFS